MDEPLMARSRNRGFRSAKVTSTKWCRQFFVDPIKDETNLVVTDPLVLCPVTTAIDSQSDIVAKTVIIEGAINRLLSSNVQQTCMYVVALQKFDFTSGVMLQVINPYSESDLASQDILAVGFLPVPPIVILADDSATVDRRSHPFHIHVKTKRKINRNTQTLTLTLASEGEGTVDSVLNARVATSLLMKWPG